MFKSKFFWLNVIALLILVIQYFINNNAFPEYVGWEGLALVVLNAIAGMIQSQQVAKLKAQLKAHK